MPVKFHTERISFNLRDKRLHKRWITQWVNSHDAVCGALDIVFVSNAQIRLINRKYLNHDHFTDVISFDYSEGKLISGDIFISVEQVRINAHAYGATEEEEIRRVMIHGVNHLMGFKDEKEEERRIMRQMENDALHLWLKMV